MTEDRKICRADVVTIPSPRLKRGEALSREFATAKPAGARAAITGRRVDDNFAPPRVKAEEKRQAASAFFGMPPGFLAAMSDPAVQRLRAMSAPHPAQVYSYGGRCYPSFEAAKRANPDMPLISNPSKGIDRGEHPERLGKAIGYSKYAHDSFGAILEIGAGKAAKKVLAPAGYVLDAVGAGAGYAASRRRGEPIDVAIVRAAAPLGGSVAGGVGGAAGGALLLGLSGSGAPVLGNVTGAVVGGVVGGIAGSHIGEGIGEDMADVYARKRRGW